MKRLLSLLALALTGCLVQGGPFINLGFEEANTNGLQIMRRTDPNIPIFYAAGTAESLLPGWEVYIATNRTSSVSYGGFRANAPDDPDTVALQYKTGQDQTSLNFHGNYAVLLNNEGPIEPIRIIQRGEVPGGAQVLLVTSFLYHGFSLIMNDSTFPNARQNIPDGRITVFSFDISPWAGQTVDLGFKAGLGVRVLLDNITFIVPEPTTTTLLGFGLVFFLSVMRKRRQGSQF